MIRKNLVTLGVASALGLGSTLGSAAPFNSFDPRSMAMGGAGVAVGNAATAPFFNPALLAVTREEDDFALELPIVGARLYDPENFKDSVDDFQTDVDSLSNNINTFNTGVSNASRDLLVTDINTVNQGVKNLSGKEIQGEGGLGLVVGIPSKKFGTAFYASTWGAIGGVVNYSQNDEQFFTDFANALGGVDFDNPASNTAAQLDALSAYVTYTTDGSGNVTSISVNDVSNQFDSTADIRGVALSEVGLSFSREFTIAGKAVAIGLTPKYVRADVFSYTADVNTADTGNFDADQWTKTYHDPNLDLGVAKNYGNGWRTGLVVKNLITRKYDTVPHPTTGQVSTIELKPQARAGLSHQNGWSTVALDVDLTKNDPVDFEGASRYVALGAELNAWDWAQLRVGYRANTLNSDRNVASAGLGLSPLGIHLDLAVAGNADEIGASLQLGFRF